MKGLILVNAYYIYESVQHQIERLQAEFALRDVTIDVWRNDRIPALIGSYDIESRVHDYDFVINLDKDEYLVSLIEKSGKRVFNKAKALAISDDKMLTYLTLAGHGIRLPKTCSAPLCYHWDGSAKWIDEAIMHLSFPIIIKECYGSLGKQVFLAEDRESLLAYENDLREKKHLLQEFIASSRGKDVRVIVIGGKAFAAMERVSTTDFRSNLTLGGKARAIPLTESFRLVAEKAAQVIGLDYCGVDLLYDEHREPVLCEVNSNAFMKGIEKVTGKNVAGRLADHILEVMRLEKR